MTYTNAQIFLRTPNGKIEPLVERGYETEGYLQALIAEHHELLAGEQIDDESPRRWLLIGKEVGITDMRGGADRWSIDHVFVDHEAIPTFVEVKRSSDPRIRREVVGQLIEYATNAAKHWQPGFLQARATQEAATRRHDLSEDLRALVEDEAEVSDFWERAEQNLQRGNLRLIFIADKIPPELRRMAEFMNDQMTNTEVLAIEVRQYVGAGGQSVIVPYALNVTERAKETKSASGRKRRAPLTREEFFSEIEHAAPGSERIAQALLSKFEALGCSLEWRQSGISVRFQAPAESDRLFTVFVIRKNASCEIGWLVRVEQRGLEAAIAQRYIESLRRVGFKIADGKDYSTPYALLELRPNLDQFVAAATRFVEEVRAAAR